ncbi:MAG TPA: NTP transferase domain-containing protein, partial [Solirubrobacterales bacterium]|nr:NTP transferase domain-containing protein [Solirubrobacterales bacterium]
MKPVVVILCGGRGTRLRERTESVPKALVEIGGRPILWHVIQIYAAQGFDRFLLATGYMGEAVAEFAAADARGAGLQGADRHHHAARQQGARQRRDQDAAGQQHQAAQTGVDRRLASLFRRQLDEHKPVQRRD